ncbi:tetratricopeptide repeat protein [Alteromonas gilva]|uniref:Sel1 repeat family protein n=1 Tax=Alteromonas gilva TaxID=2987522 RepID=A0ABT5L1L2_9ALTE|nr:sel1 repeat family protein [Alteromonas gilva]MDC8830924.1 sel1 repeat family protein [Alteromonas gilva]
MMFRATCIAVFTSLTIAADSGHLPSQLLANAERAAEPAPLLWVAVQAGSQEARARLLAQAEASEDEYWLEKLIQVGYSPAALELSRLKEDPRLSGRLVKLAARGGVAEAQYEYALIRDDYKHRETWLTAAAEQDYFIAQTALADWYLLHDAQAKAEPWLVKTAARDSQSAYQLAFIRWQQGSENEAFELFKQAAQQDHVEAQRVLSVLKQYQPVSLSALAETPAAEYSNVSCKQRIQPFATGLAEIVQANRIYQQYQQDKRLSQLPLCVEEPVWLERQALNCNANWQGQGRLGCDIAALDEVTQAKGFTHAVILAKSGKANVNNGVMYLDVGDTYSVFVHELAHFVGFVDEYPLTRELAREYCQRKTAPNLVFLGQITYAPLSNIDFWETFEYPVSLYPSRTCNNIGVKSYKPSERITFMENHDAHYIPPLYLSIWRQRLQQRSSQRPIAMNFFQHYEKAGNIPKAAYWLDVLRQQRREPDPIDDAPTAANAARKLSD